MIKRLALAALLALAACAPPGAGPGRIDQARLLAAEEDPDNWLAYGRTYAEQRFSPLAQIDGGNVARLSLAFAVPLDTTRGQEATPLVVDGVMYFSTAWSHVYAVRADTGEVLWRYDPHNIGAQGAAACCDVVNRGAAVWQGKVFVGTIDGRLVALDAASGQPLWETLTVDRSKPYTVTMAPRVVHGKVIIGNSGAELGVRGYVSAYDAETGKLVWRFYTVPPNPADGPDHAASDEAFAKFAGATWNGNWWEQGGGGTVWDSVVYDAEFDQLLVGVGNGSPWNHRARSAGKGDNLFLASILALDPDTGAYKWHYQLNPGETWDFTATQQMILADLTIGGKPRKVAMQAPKNGFFYVVDRTNGQLISAKSYVSVNTWASGVDANGRPILQPGAHNTTTPHLMSPSWLAGHTWHPMSYNPATGLVYLSAQEQGSVYARAEDGQYHYTPGPGRTNSGQAYGTQPDLRAQLQAQANATEKGYLLAWNPRTQTEAWRVTYPHPGSGGVLTTAGNLLIQGTINETIAIYRADTGAKLWEMNIDQAPVAGAVTYMIDGEQYIAINAGWGGSPVYNLGPFQTATAKLLVFKLGGTAKLPPMVQASTTLPRPPFLRAPEAQVAEGRELFGANCSKCHGENAIGGVKDLRFLTAATHAEFADIVLRGARAEAGMASFEGQLSESQVEAIHAYLIARGNEDYADAAAKGG